MKLNRWVHVAAGLAIVAGGVAAAAPAAQASTRPPANTGACLNTIVTATNRLDPYDISIAGEFAAAPVAEGANIAMKELAAAASGACAGLESYIGADLTAEQSQIAAALQSIAQEQWTTAGDQLEQATRTGTDVFLILYALLHPTS